MDPLVVPAAVAQTHALLFEVWFPLQQLPIPPHIRPDIEEIAGQVSSAMLASLTNRHFSLSWKE
jgi:hypothetical protein